MIQPILHQYDVSPFARKVKMALAIKGVAWRACTQPVIAPKPDLLPLTGGYRRIPILQMGADLYCDSDLILRVLDRLFPDPPLGCDGAHAMTFALSPWFGQQLTQVAVPISFAGAEAVDPAFAKDREQVMGGPFVDLERWRAEAPHARETLRAQLGWIDAVLSDGRPWLSGDAPGLLDIFAYPNLGFLRERQTELPGLDQFEHMRRWERRAEALGDGVRSEITPQNAIEVAKTAVPRADGEVLPGEPNGLEVGMQVVVHAQDYGKDPITGTLAAASDQAITIRRTDPRVGEVTVSFPRMGFAVDRA